MLHRSQSSWAWEHSWVCVWLGSEAGGRSCYEHRLGSGRQSPDKALVAFCPLSRDQISPGETQRSVCVLASQPGAVPASWRTESWLLFFFFLFSVYSPQKVVCNILEYFCWANCIKQGLSFYTASGRPSQPSWGIMALALSRSTYRVKIRLPACLPILFKLKALSIYKSSELK